MKIINPNYPIHVETYNKHGMEYFIGLCESLDGVFFAPCSNDKLGAGVYKEVWEGFAHRGKPVWQYSREDHSFELISMYRVPNLARMSIEETKAQVKFEKENNIYKSLESYRNYA